MILTRTPLRLSLAGGGTDLPSFYKRHGGFIVSGAINKYIYTALHPSFEPGYNLKYSQHEKAETIFQIKHHIIRAAFEMHDIAPGIDLASFADIPAGTGLGSSSSFTVGLLRALYRHKKQSVSPKDLAEEAFHIERIRLCNPVGKQDQYIAAYGGLQCMEISTTGEVEIKPLQIAPVTLDKLGKNLLMFYTGKTRDANKHLAVQDTLTEDDDSDMITNLLVIKSIGRDIHWALVNGDLDKFGDLLNAHWEMKQRRSGNLSTSKIDECYVEGIDAGALGGKLVGAGGGGFLMFYTNDPGRLREAMAKAGLKEVPFKFDFTGSSTLLME